MEKISGVGEGVAEAKDGCVAGGDGGGVLRDQRVVGGGRNSVYKSKEYSYGNSEEEELKQETGGGHWGGGVDRDGIRREMALYYNFKGPKRNNVSERNLRFRPTSPTLDPNKPGPHPSAQASVLLGSKSLVLILAHQTVADTSDVAHGC